MRVRVTLRFPGLIPEALEVLGARFGLQGLREAERVLLPALEETQAGVGSGERALRAVRVG